MMNVLTKKEFETAVLEGMQKEFPDAKVVIKDIDKINNISYRGLCFEQGLSAVINLEDFYNENCTQDSIPGIVAKIKDTFLTHSQFPSDIDLSAIHSYDHAKDYLNLYVINAESNKELIKKNDLVTLPYMDLALGVMVFYPEGRASIKVTKYLAERWGVSIDELFVKAKENTNSLYSFESMDHILREFGLFGDNGDEDSEFEVNKQDLSVAKNGSMYVLTNNYKQFGAANIANVDLLDRIAENMECDYYILPSSIHELIIVKDDDSMDAEKLKEMVRDVNDTQVEAMEILSYSVYKYCRDQKAVVKMA